MAQYFDDFSVGTTGAIPPGWTQFGDATQRIFLYDEPTAANGRAMRFHVTNSPNRMIWANFDAVPQNTQNVQILTKVKRSQWSTANSYMGLFLRANGSTDWYTNAFAERFHFNIVLRENSINTGLASQNNYFPNDTNVWRFLRFDAQGSILRARGWIEGEEEPATWNMTVENSVLTQGAVGVFNFVIGASNLFDFFSVGTDGDPAPSGPVNGLSIPTLTAPANTATGVALRPTFSWS